LATLNQSHYPYWLTKFLRFKDIKLLHSAIYLSDLNKCPENHAVWSLPYNSNIFKKSTKKAFFPKSFSLLKKWKTDFRKPNHQHEFGDFL